MDAAIVGMAEHSEFTDLVHRLGCLLGISTLTGFGLAVEVGDWTRFTGSTVGHFLGLVMATPAGCWSKQPGTTARPTAAQV